MSARKRVDLERLRAAYQAKGLSWHQLGKTARISHANISRLVSGRIKTVRSSTLQRLAAALEVPQEWLTDERRDLPYVPEYDWTRRRGEGPSRWERPAAEDVRWSWLLQRVDAAIERDLREWYGEEEAPHVYDSWGRALGRTVFTALASFLLWRSVCLVRPAGGVYMQAPDESPAIKWLMALLDPWFTGGAYLNAEVLRGVFEALSPGRAMFTSPTREADGVRALVEYAKACERFVQERLGTLGPEPEEGGGAASTAPRAKAGANKPGRPRRNATRARRTHRLATRHNRKSLSELRNQAPDHPPRSITA
jgi:transcriptional regulator with XRE-family HTH domain